MRTFNQQQYGTRFTVYNGESFLGFNHDFSTPHVLLLVQDEDVCEAWALDGVSSIPEFMRYIERSQSQYKLIGTYSEEGFRGFIVPLERVSSISRFR